MTRPIPRREDLHLLLSDGWAWTEFRLDDRRLVVTGYERDQDSNGLHPMHCTTHALADIKQIHELTGAVIDALEGPQ